MSPSAALLLQSQNQGCVCNHARVAKYHVHACVPAYLCRCHAGMGCMALLYLVLLLIGCVCAPATPGDAKHVHQLGYEPEQRVK